MASFHFVSAEGSAFPLAWRLKQDGHSVTWQCTEEYYRPLGKGLVEVAAPG